MTVLDQPLIFASDIDGGACERLAGMILGNGLSDAVKVAQKDVFQCEANQYGGGQGLVTINPPYGIRIGSANQAAILFNRICRHLVQRLNGWEVVLIASNRDLARQLPFAARRLPLFHGGLKLTLIVGTIQSCLSTKGLLWRRGRLFVWLENECLASDGRLEHQTALGMGESGHSLVVFTAGLIAG